MFSVLVDGDDHNDPVADTIRGTLDGHIVLDRAIADQGRYPAVNVLASVSRLAHHVWSKEQRALVMKLRAMIARFESSRDLRLMGGYHAGSDPLMDQAVSFRPENLRRHEPVAATIRRARTPSANWPMRCNWTSRPRDEVAADVGKEGE